MYLYNICLFAYLSSLSIEFSVNDAFVKFFVTIQQSAIPRGTEQLLVFL